MKMNTIQAEQTLNNMSTAMRPGHFAQKDGRGYVTPGYVTQLLQAAVRSKDDITFLVLALALFAGLRREELLDLHMSWLSREGHAAILVEHGDGSLRVVLVPRWLCSRLFHFAHGSRSCYLLGEDRGQREATVRVAEEWLRANLGITLHTLRVYAAVRLAHIWGVERTCGALGMTDDVLGQLLDRVCPESNRLIEVPHLHRTTATRPTWLCARTKETAA